MLEFFVSFWTAYKGEIIKYFILFFVLLFFKRGNIDKKFFMEVFDMVKEKKDESATSNVSAITGQTSKGQTFSKFQNVYRLNKQTGVLEKTEDVIDVSELIQSCKQTCLDSCLERFLPQEQVVDEVADNLNRTLDVMDILREGIDTAERYRAEFQLDPTLSVYDVFEEVKKRSESLNARLKTLKEEALKSEVKVNETSKSE